MGSIHQCSCGRVCRTTDGHPRGGTRDQTLQLWVAVMWNVLSVADIVLIYTFISETFLNRPVVPGDAPNDVLDTNPVCNSDMWMLPCSCYTLTRVKHQQQFFNKLLHGNTSIIGTYRCLLNCRRGALELRKCSVLWNEMHYCSMRWS
jgi:hypothetical protein